jgi:predicted N-formylglutamate amidohydrolase
MKMILSCEHATATVPEEYAGLFAGASHIFATHRSYDIGAFEVGKMVEDLAGDAFYGKCNRLLVDLNRSLHHPRLFSSFSQNLPRSAKELIIADWYYPFRNLVLHALDRTIAQHGEVLHISMHSFTPVLDGVVRPNDIGILYDPGRHREKAWAIRLANTMRAVQPNLSVRMNFPYRGLSDSHTTALRRRFSKDVYLGIELEINQRLLEDDQGRTRVGKLLRDAFKKTGIGISKK